MSTVGARVEMGARYHGGACLGSFVGDKRRRLFEPDFPQSARPSVAASEGTGFCSAGGRNWPIPAHGVRRDMSATGESRRHPQSIRW
jgi:hypothetical protein